MREFTVPSGLRDFVLDEAKKKKMLQLELEKRLDTWGYTEVMTPSVEFYKTYEVGFDDIKEEELYKFMDDNGRILTLRTDMTIPIARLVATKFKNTNETLRFRYCANVFKVHETLSGNKNEITDCGVELIGIDKKTGDLEILATALDALEVIKHTKFTLEIGNAQFFKAACKGAKISNEQAQTLATLIDQKSLIELKQYLNEIQLTSSMREFFLKMVWWNGDVKVLEEAKVFAFNDELVQILNELIELNESLSMLGYQKHITFDLGKIGNLNYYTGIIFDAFAQGVGLRVMSGGRYDNLIKKYGVDLPAVGFSIKLDQLMNAYTYEETSNEIIIEYNSNCILEAIQKRKMLETQSTIILKQNNSIEGIRIVGGKL